MSPSVCQCVQCGPPEVKMSTVVQDVGSGVTLPSPNPTVLGCKEISHPEDASWVAECSPKVHVH